MLVLMFVFDWRMGRGCLLAAVISILAMCSMMGGKNAALMAEYQAAQDRMTKSGTEYVRGIPVVKIFQQTVYSFKAFQQGHRGLQRQGGALSGRCVPCAPVHQPDLHRGRLSVSGAGGAVPGSRVRWLPVIMRDL